MPSKRQAVHDEGLQPSISPPKRSKVVRNDDRTLVCVVSGIVGRPFTVTISADASIHDLKKKIYEENATLLKAFPATLLDVHSTQQLTGQWARLDEDGTIEELEEMKSAPPLPPTERVGNIFPAMLPRFDSGVAHVVAGVMTSYVKSARPKLAAVVLPDDRPTEGDDLDGEIARHFRVKERLGLFVNWSINGTDFSKKHDYPSAKWLYYSRWADESTTGRLFIGNTKTWRDLYIACNAVVQKAEGLVDSRYVEGFHWKDKQTLELRIGT
ncbi:hypothetical protein PHYBOEH_010072 [Phytophthora boehmeriae]|uniref:Crinkler effector protein N-terminal domain-containing protein n=1 Tax=Phytophthora boehmeriae TaxID=109152 RepID=A0A8T1VSQ0_9STRA|nr:hypothetical protein PHYBOEH_010072 [Phytophthora boehmeriae]